jgi:hypothetical protein
MTNINRNPLSLACMYHSLYQLIWHRFYVTNFLASRTESILHHTFSHKKLAKFLKGSDVGV